MMIARSAPHHSHTALGVWRSANRVEAGTGNVSACVCVRTGITLLGSNEETTRERPRLQANVPYGIALEGTGPFYVSIKRAPAFVARVLFYASLRLAQANSLRNQTAS